MVRPGDVCEITSHMVDKRVAGDNKIFMCSARLDVNGKLCCKGDLSFALVPIAK